MVLNLKKHAQLSRESESQASKDRNELIVEIREQIRGVQGRKPFICGRGDGRQRGCKEVTCKLVLGREGERASMSVQSGRDQLAVRCERR